MRTEDQIRQEIDGLADDVEANNANIAHAQQFPAGSERATAVIERCTVNNLAIRCRVDALNWVLGEG